MGTASEILYCHAEEDTDRVGAGDWFFHAGQCAQCAQAYPDDSGGWHLYIDFEKAGKPLSQQEWRFDTIEECKALVASYFEHPVVEIAPDQFPEPDL